MAGTAAVLCDWDGCLAVGDRLDPVALDFLRGQRRVAILSNSSTMTRAECAARLAAGGVALSPEHIHLAGEALLEEALRCFGTRPVHLVAAPAMRRRAEGMGLRLRDDDVEAVLLLRDPGFDDAALRRVTRLLAGDVAYWIANPDLSHPSADGAVPETGALAAAIEAAGGRRPDRVIGKPSALLFDRAVAALDLPRTALLMIGDNPATDIEGARSAGIDALLVGPETWRGPDAGLSRGTAGAFSLSGRR